YDPALKSARLALLREDRRFEFVIGDVADRDLLPRVFARTQPQHVIHLAAQAGVRHSLKAPEAYVDSNLVGFANILEACRHHGVKHLTFASSSSVYGANAAMPFSPHDGADHPLSLYAATKKANEVMAHAYSHLFRLPTTGLRFFTVYGPWGRPDMALFQFTEAILQGKPIALFNQGNMRRDFTYIDDIVEGVVRASDHVAQPNQQWDPLHPDPASSHAPFRLYNIGSHRPVAVMDVVREIERALGRRAELEYLPMQPGDVLATFADVTDLADAVDSNPSTPIEVGIPRFVEWYRGHYRH
ncbi:MAG: NAD-dependent epimerase/dehydratase family protein, partial [Verrucomicrobiota bacterium]